MALENFKNIFKDENDINQTLCSYRMTRDIIFEKINQRFQDYF